MTPKRITLTVEDDSSDPDVGDYLRSSRSRYLVISARRVRTRDGARRFALGVVNVEEIPPGARAWSMRWHPRRKVR